MSSLFTCVENSLLNCKNLRLKRTDVFLVQVTRIRRKHSKRVSRKRLQGGTYRCLVPPNRLARGASAKDVCRAVLDQVPSALSDAFQLGTTKVFVREALEQYLEQERVALLRASIVVIQRHVRGYLARRQYTAMRSAALRIQAAYRGYAARSRYRTIRRGVIRAQANYRMLRQKREYDKIKAILARKREADRLALERAKERMARDERASRAVAGVNHLEIPAELAFILSKLDDWPGYPGAVARAPSSSTSGSSLSGVTPLLTLVPRQLPGDVDQHAFSKFTSIYFKSHVWGMKREPIRTPFLAKSSDAQHQESLACSSWDCLFGGFFDESLKEV
ncbi:hypothetical protein HPB50_010768 [Hyalomma asiaticum]|uniref:Uncharacterized protein n=1 Tax=Hyalomma asiaticum TaxID=266040 RepID=A0ACB7T978_HYAAI|nr:hypothetical protein HPB50_010768 [Hyalomma asiaticum]